tara:strand:- start:23 stop:334 length:312 start_codon:yes stop_codon:yes gene_type:complete
LEEWPLDQFSICSKSIQSLFVAHGLDGCRAKRSITLTAGVEQRFAITEKLQSGTQLKAGWWLTDDVVKLIGNALISKPCHCLSAGAAAAVAEHIHQGFRQFRL